MSMMLWLRILNYYLSTTRYVLSGARPLHTAFYLSS